MDPHVRRGAIDVGPAAELVAEPVADRVLHLQRRELEALQRALLRRDVDPDLPLHGKVPWPVHCLYGGVVVVFVLVGEIRDAPKDPRRDARPEVGAIADLPGAAERDPSGRLLQFFSTKGRQFLEKQLFQATRTAREEGLRTA